MHLTHACHPSLTDALVQQIDLVQAQHAPVRLGKQPRLQRGAALAHRCLDVDGPDDTVLSRAQGNTHEGAGAYVHMGVGGQARLPLAGAVGVGVGPGTAHHAEGGQQLVHAARQHCGQVGCGGKVTLQ